MTFLQDLDFKTILGWALLHSVWQGLVVWLVYRMARFVTQRPAIRYVVGNVCVVAFVLAQATTFAFFILAEARPDWADRFPISLSTFAARPVHPDQPYYLSRVMPAPSVWADVADAARPYLAFAGIIWAIALVFRFLENLGALYLLGRELRRCTELKGELRDLAEAAAVKLNLKQPIRFLVTASASVPATAGWLKPVVLVPTAAALKMTPKELEALVCHELAHIARNDYLAHLFRTFVDAIYFYHPALRNVMRHVVEDAEAATDEVAARVFGHRRNYANALVLLEERRCTLRRFVLGATGGTLETRLRNLIANHAAPPRGQLRLSMASPFALVMLLFLLLSQGVAGAATEQALIQQTRVRTFQSLIVSSVAVDRDNPFAQGELQRAIAELRNTKTVSETSVISLSTALASGIRSDLILSIEGVALSTPLERKLAPGVVASFGSSVERRTLIGHMHDVAVRSKGSRRKMIFRAILVLGCLDPATSRAPTGGSIFNNVEFIRSLELEASRRRKFDVALVARGERTTFLARHLIRLSRDNPPQDPATVQAILEAFVLDPQLQLRFGALLSLESHRLLAQTARSANDPQLERSLARLLREADLDEADPQGYPRERVEAISSEQIIGPKTPRAFPD